MKKKAVYMMSEVNTAEVLDEFSVPDIDMDAITAAINGALADDRVDGDNIISPLPIELTEEVVAEAEAAKKDKASKMTLKDLSGKKKKDAPAKEAADGEPTEKKPRAPRTENPKLSHYGTPILRSAKDKCSACAAVVKWHSTTDDAGNPIWICAECGREVPRRAK